MSIPREARMRKRYGPSIDLPGGVSYNEGKVREMEVLTGRETEWRRTQPR